MARFTYIQETDTEGNNVGTTILETGGYFAGYTPAEIEAVAEGHFPRYSSGNLSETFSSIYFNHTLRGLLNANTDAETSKLSDHLQSGDGVRGTEAGRARGDTCGKSEEGDTDCSGH